MDWILLFRFRELVVTKADDKKIIVQKQKDKRTKDKNIIQMNAHLENVEDVSLVGGERTGACVEEGEQAFHLDKTCQLL